MYCNKCGSPINVGDKFCQNCGKAQENTFQSDQISNETNQIPSPQPVSNPQFQIPTNQNNPNIKKYLPFIIAGVVILIIMIVVISNIGSDNSSLNNNDSNNNPTNNSESQTQEKLVRNYKVKSPATENSFKNLTFAEGEKYLKDIGFTEVTKEPGGYILDGRDNLDGYSASAKPYGSSDNYRLIDSATIVFDNNQIFLSKVDLKYKKEDVKIDNVYEDLSRLMSAFNGYKIDKEKLQTALTSAENYNDPDFSLKFGTEYFYYDDVAFTIDVTIYPSEEYLPEVVYGFKITQSYRI